MKRLAIMTATVVATLAGVWLLWQFRSVLVLFVLSLALAAALRPLVEHPARAWHLPRPAAVLAVYALTLLAVIGIVMAVSGPLLDELRRVADQSVLTYDQIWISWPFGTPFQQSIASWMPPPQVLYAAVTGERGAAMEQSLLGVTASLVDQISRLSIVVVMSIYWGLDQARFERLWLSLLPAVRRARAVEIWRAIEVGLGAYLRSELLQSLLAGVLLGVGYRLLNLPYPVLVGTLSALVWLVPWLGAALGLGLVLLAGLGAGAWVTLAACVYTVLVFALLEFAVEPRLYNRRQFSSLLVMVLVVALWHVAGLAGLLAAPPLAAALQLLVNNLLAPSAAPAIQPAAEDVQPIAARFAELEGRLASLDANLGAGAEAPSPQMASLVSRLFALVSNARQALLHQGALPAAGSPGASAGPSAGRSGARPR